MRYLQAVCASRSQGARFTRMRLNLCSATEIRNTPLVPNIRDRTCSCRGHGDMVPGIPERIGIDE